MSGLSTPLVENRGRYPTAVRYFVEASGRTVFFTSSGVTFRLAGEPAWTVKLSFVDGAEVVPVGEAKADTVVSYFRGGGRSQAGLPTYERIVYRDVWPGIDVVYKIVGSRLKYDAVVHPGADPTRARFRYKGAERIARTDAGGLRVITPAGEIEEEPPVVHQLAGDTRESVAATLVVNPAPDGCDVAFDVAAYDRTRPLVIDPPMLIYCGYLGGAQSGSITDVAVDPKGALYVTGSTFSDETTFPVKVGPDLTHNSRSFSDAFVAKVRIDGTGLVYCGFIGGASRDSGIGIAVDATGAAYVTGTTDSTEATFPVVGGPSLTIAGGYDGFVAKVRPDGRLLDYCGYIGGTGLDQLTGIAVDALGSAYVVGATTSPQASLPIRVGPSLKANGSQSVLVARVKPDGSGLDYCGFISGAGQETGRAIAVDPWGAAYVVGATTSDEQSLPVRVGPLLVRQSPTQPPEGFVAKVNASGASLDFCGFIGGIRGADFSGIAVDPTGRASVCGRTLSTESTFPVAVGPGLVHRSSGATHDGFVGRLRPDGSGWEYLGYIGGSAYDSADAVAVDAGGRATVVGVTRSSDFLVVGPSFPYLGNGDAFIARVDPAGAALEYCTLLGSALSDDGRACATDPLGNNAWVAGSTWANQTQFPVRVGPDLTYNRSSSGADQFVAKIQTTDLKVGGSSRIGGLVTLNLSDDGGLSYQVGSSLGTGPTPIGTRPLGLSADALLLLSTSGLAPGTFAGYGGVLDNHGAGLATVRVPNQQALIGLFVYSAFVTFKPGAPQGIHSISNTESFRIN